MYIKPTNKKSTICINIDQCRTASKSKGLKLGGKCYKFKGAYKTKGCYTYKKGNKYHGRKKKVNSPKIRIKC